MTIPTAVLLKLATLGLSEAQAEAVASMLSAVEVATKADTKSESEAGIEAGREKARARWRKWKAGQPETNVSKRLQPLANDSKQLTSEPARVEDNLPNKKTSKKENKGGRATRLAADWQIPGEWIDEAITAGMSHFEAHASAARMKNWSISTTGAVKLDWHATWQNWFARDLKDRKPHATAPPKRSTVGSLFRDDFRKMIDDPGSNNDGRLASSDGFREDGRTGIARRVAVQGIVGRG